MQGDDFFSMVKYARERRIWVRITTNASLLHLKGNYKKLIDSGVNEIDISIDGADAQTFEGIRIQSDFSRVKENCRMLNSYAHARGLPGAKMWTLVQKGNVERLENHVNLAAWLGFRHLVFSLQLHGWGDDELAVRNRGEMVSVSEERCWQLVKAGEAVGVRVSFWDVAEKFSTESAQTLCPWPFERAVVTSDERTVPCCMIGSPDAFEFGRGTGKTFLQNWTGEEYREFRQAHLDGNVPQVCRGCYR
jgi:MoaA/NifB/PqqE/SkfB family radical SAM enzyme